MKDITKKLVKISENIAQNKKTWIPKKKWNKSKNKLHWWKEEPYRELDVLKYKDGWWVFYNNLGIHKRPFKTKTCALQSAKKFMKRRR